MLEILSIAFLIGAAIGWFKAGKSGGNRLDKLQYAAAHGIALLLLTLVLVLLGLSFGFLA